VFAKNGAACRNGELVPLLRRLDAEIQALRDSLGMCVRAFARDVFCARFRALATMPLRLRLLCLLSVDGLSSRRSVLGMLASLLATAPVLAASFFSRSIRTWLSFSCFCWLRFAGLSSSGEYESASPLVLCVASFLRSFFESAIVV